MLLQYRSGTLSAKESGGIRTLVEGVTFSLDAGESLALIGETGSGKTMIARSVMGLLPPDVQADGLSVTLDGYTADEAGVTALLGREIVYIPQNGGEFLAPQRTVRKQLYDGLRRMGLPRKAFASAAAEKLRAAGFPEPDEVLGKYPFQLSGGMAQRVTIALAACSNARLILADEPTNGLDEAGRVRFFDLLRELFPHAGILLITHDMDAAALCRRVLVLCGGRSMEQGDTAAVLAAPKHPYTRALLAARVRSGMVGSPVLRQKAGSCPYSHRCPDFCDRCLQPIPENRENGREWRCCI